MTKRQIYHIVEWLIALAGCGFLVWKLVTYDDYAALGNTLQSMDWKQWSMLALCLLLMPINMTIEAWRWKTLVPMTWRESHRQVYYSKLAGLITPWRLGEYPARALLIKSEGVNELTNERVWSRVLSMGAVGSATMTAAIIASGLLAMMVYGVECMVYEYYLLIVAAVLLLLSVGLYFAPRLLRRWATVSHKLVAISLVQSFVRLLCWCVQLALVIVALSSLRYDVMTLLRLSFVYYLFVTITPNVPIAEVGVRGAWAIVVFGSVNAALAGVLLWGINTLLPCLIWHFLRKNAK